MITLLGLLGDCQVVWGKLRVWFLILLGWKNWALHLNKDDYVAGGSTVKTSEQKDWECEN